MEKFQVYHEILDNPNFTNELKTFLGVYDDYVKVREQLKEYGVIIEVMTCQSYEEQLRIMIQNNDPYFVATEESPFKIKKISCIKWYREKTGLGLIESKDAVCNLIAKHFPDKEQ